MGWSLCVAIEIFVRDALPGVNLVTGTLLSAVAGYLVASSVGATFDA
jgi:hypothetical protein